MTYELGDRVLEALAIENGPSLVLRFDEIAERVRGALKRWGRR